MKLRKLVAIILTMSLCMGTMVQAASSQAIDVNQETKNESQREVAFAGRTYVKSHDYDNIYEDGNQYIMVVNNSDNPSSVIVIPMECKEISFNDQVAVESFLHRDDIPKEALESFNEKYTSYLAYEGSKVEEPILTLFEPAENAASRSIGDPDSIVYNTYNNWPMKSYFFYYTNLSSGWVDVKTGRGTLDFLRTVFDIGFSVGAELIDSISYISTGQSILEAFLDYCGLDENYITKTVDDYFQARLVWDQSEQYTMRDFGGMTSWQVGLVTYRVTVQRIAQETYFKNSGEGPYFTERPVYQVFRSEHYDNPWATAFENGAYAEWEYVKWTTGGVTYTFS